MMNKKVFALAGLLVFVANVVQAEGNTKNSTQKADRTYWQAAKDVAPTVLATLAFREIVYGAARGPATVKNTTTQKNESQYFVDWNVLRAAGRYTSANSESWRITKLWTALCYFLNRYLPV